MTKTSFGIYIYKRFKTPAHKCKQQETTMYYATTNMVGFSVEKLQKNKPIKDNKGQNELKLLWVVLFLLNVQWTFHKVWTELRTGLGHTMPA